MAKRRKNPVTDRLTKRQYDFMKKLARGYKGPTNYGAVKMEAHRVPDYVYTLEDLGLVTLSATDSWKYHGRVRGRAGTTAMLTRDGEELMGTPHSRLGGRRNNPIKSKAQWRALAAKMTRGEISKRDWKKLVGETKRSYRRLPEYAKKKRNPMYGPGGPKGIIAGWTTESKYKIERDERSRQIHAALRKLAPKIIRDKPFELEFKAGDQWYKITAPEVYTDERGKILAVDGLVKKVYGRTGNRKRNPAVRKADEFMASYINTMLWATNDESDESGGRPLDENFDGKPGEFGRGEWAKIYRETQKFQDQNWDDISDDLGRAGHDFFLTRNGHGAGFWDGDWPDAVGKRLTKAAKKFGESQPYVGDDGKLYLG